MSEGKKQLYCYMLAPNPYEAQSMNLMHSLPFKDGDINHIDMFLLDKILKQVPGYAEPPGATHMAPGITRFLARNRLVVSLDDGLIRTPEGEYLVNYLQQNPPAPGELNFPTDFGLDKLPSQDKYLGLIRLPHPEE